MAETCEVTVAGVVARSVLDVLRTRFDVVTARPVDRRAGLAVDRTVLTVTGVDQPAVRALMVMLWDSGHDVLAMSTATGGRLGGGSALG